MAGFTPGLAIWKIAFQLSPIVLVNGLVENFPGHMLPIVAITEAINLPLGLLSGGENVELDGFFANYRPMPGATILDQDIGRYPFANQAVAANAVIVQPLNISMEMMVIARYKLGYFAKLAVMIALRETLYAHNAAGGTYIIATPSFIYTNCVMRTLRDISGGETKQPQYKWQIDFERPLITLDQAAAAESSLTNKFTQQTKPNGPLGFSGIGNQGAQSLATPGLAPISSSGGPSSGTIGVPVGR